MRLMEEEKKLYPLRFAPVAVEHAWGTEVYQLADLGVIDSEACSGWLSGDSLSDIMETYIDRVVGDDVYYYYGRQFPVAVRSLQVTGRTPVWVCPDDKVAGERYDALGKAKLWYVTAARPGARVYLGLEKEMTATDLYRACMDGSLGGSLHAETPSVGQWYLIEPGVLHGAEQVDLVEVSEASLLDISVFDWGAFLDSEDLGVVDAMDFIRLQAQDASAAAPAPQHHHHDEIRPEDRLTDTLAEIEPFTVTRVRLSDALHIYTEQFGSFLAYTCLEGGASVQATLDAGMERFHVGKGETLLLPAEMPDFFLVPENRDTVLLETRVQPSQSPDSYINTDAEPFLEGEDYSKDEDLDDRIDWSLAHPDN